MKLKNLTIENFRSFHRFDVNNLGRVNLLVGTNNSGKTTVLEAAYLLLDSNQLWAIWTLLANRGETYSDESPSGQPILPNSVIGVRHLFRGHSVVVGARFKITANSDGGPFETRAYVRSTDPKAKLGSRVVFNENMTTSTTPMPTLTIPTLLLKLRSEHPLAHPGRVSRIEVPLNRDAGFTSTSLQERLTHGLAGALNYSAQFVAATSLTSQRVATLFDGIALTKEEDWVLEALQILEPKVERIATTRTGGDPIGVSGRGGILLRLANIEARVPIGSMGDGIWRMLGLALAVIYSRDKVLLIDEVDTGLHHSVMGKMWRFLNECAKRFNVQIIATTHSKDCYQSLAEICREDVVDQSEVTIQRIERGSSEAVAYSEAEIYAAAVRDVEVR